MNTKRFPFHKTILFCSLLFVSVGAIAQETTGEFTPGPNDIKSINAEYHPQVVGISENGMIQGVNAMRAYLMEFYRGEGAKSVSEEPFRTAVHEKMDFEIGTFQTETKNHFATMSIWLKDKGLEQRILEVVYKMSEKNETNALAEINQARQKWVKLCNAHNAGNLVSELYTEDAIYYNRGRILIGREKLSTEYSYMNNPSYSLDLTPSHLQQVTDDMVFELGKCSGSYNLPYLLIWKKEADGNWRIYFDSNY